MPYNYHDLISRKIKDIPFSYTDTQMLLYNLSVGMGRDPDNRKELAFVYEQPGLQVIPTAATILGGGASVLSGADLDWPKVLHAEQRLQMHRTLPPSADVVGTTRISEIVDKGAEKGALITTEIEARLSTGEPLYTMHNVIFARGDGGNGGLEKSATQPHTIPDCKPDLIYTTETLPDQALLYRLNGDRNPLHVDPDVAARAGYPAPILHGLCSYGIACRAVLASACDYDPAKIKRFDVRFTSPVYSGETIETEIWLDGNQLSFRCKVKERERIIIDNGLCQLAH